MTSNNKNSRIATVCQVCIRKTKSLTNGFVDTAVFNGPDPVLLLFYQNVRELRENRICLVGAFIANDDHLEMG